MNQLIQQYKPHIDKRIKELTLKQKTTTIPWAQEVNKSLESTTLRGKSIRGSLVLTTVDLFHPPFTNDALSVATAIEYLHTALLIHDDLIDHDELRRGFPSMFKEYEEKGLQHHATNPHEFGKSMALCIGDVAIFQAFSMLSSLTLESTLHKNIIQLITHEFCIVGYGELHDIALGYVPAIPTSSEVLDMYIRKTARYTFSVPMMIGAMLADQPTQIIEQLDRLGEKIGLIFQLTDDQLTLLGDVATVGKTIGNDISENKKTLYHVLLRERASKKDNELLDTIFGHNDISDIQIDTVRQLIEKYKVETHIQNQIEKLYTEAITLIATLPLSQDNLTVLHTMVSMVTHRKK